MNQGISDITPLTLLDYPGKASCILWFAGCNMRCLYCYNADLVQQNRQSRDACFPSVPHVAGLREFLEERAGFLDAVVASGGECTLNPRLPEICRMARELGYLVKIDTNGSNPAVVRRLVADGLVDFIALDYKAPPSSFEIITRCRVNIYKRFSETLDWLIGSGINFEVRTTVHPDLLDENNINRIIDDLASRGYKGTYYLQHYFHTSDNLGKLSLPRASFDSALLSDGLEIQLRHFPAGGGSRI